MALHHAPLQHPVSIAGAEPLFIKPRPGRAWQDMWAGRDSQGAEGRPDVLIPAFIKKESLLPGSEGIKCGCGAAWRISPSCVQHNIMSTVQASLKQRTALLSLLPAFVVCFCSSHIVGTRVAGSSPPPQGLRIEITTEPRQSWPLSCKKTQIMPVCMFSCGLDMDCMGRGTWSQSWLAP